MARKKSKSNEWAFWLISEIALVTFLFFVLDLLKVEANLWISSFILLALLNISIIFCPIVRKCFK